MTRKYVGVKYGKRRVILVGWFIQVHSAVGSESLAISVLLLVQGKHLFPGKFHSLLLGGKWEIRELFQELVPAAQSNMTSSAYCGVACSEPP